MRLFRFQFAVALLGLGGLVHSSRADTHIFVGALGTNQNDKLIFSNGGSFDAYQTTYWFPQVLRTNGLNKGHYRGDVLSFTGLAGTPPNGGPVASHAAFGSRLAVQVVSVEGPPGGSFAFWEGDGESDLGNITFSVPVGTANGSNVVVVSENNSEPGADPYGHIHGREYTTSVGGTYVVGFRAIDVGTNGAGGGPIHSPSDILPVRFQAGLKIQSIQIVTNRAIVSFRSPPGISNLLEAAGSVPSMNWQATAPPVRGNNALQSFTDTNAISGDRYYRIRQLNNLP